MKYSFCGPRERTWHYVTLCGDFLLTDVGNTNSFSLVICYSFYYIMVLHREALLFLHLVTVKCKTDSYL